MSAQIIDGKMIADSVKAELIEQIQKLGKEGKIPSLAAILVGEDPASQIYVGMKSKACEELGIESRTLRFPKDITEEALLREVKSLNEDESIDGILIQLPLPDHIRETNVLSAVSIRKDVDGFHPANVGRMLSGDPLFLPATPQGIQEMLIRSGNDPEGRDVVIVGRSNIVGKPLAAMLMQKGEGANATVTVCHSKTKNLKEHCRRAEILVVAIGQPEFIRGDMVSEGSVVIDVGVNRVPDPSSKKGYKVVGDICFEEVVKKAKAISPVPGGVGPMTIAMLMKNTVKAARMRLNQKD